MPEDYKNVNIDLKGGWCFEHSLNFFWTLHLYNSHITWTLKNFKNTVKGWFFGGSGYLNDKKRFNTVHCALGDGAQPNGGLATHNDVYKFR